MAADDSSSSPSHPQGSGENINVENHVSLQQPKPEPVYEKPYGLDWLNNAEDMEEYRPGGLHPVDMFDMLDGRFEVCHKLGSGGIATVWLCHEKLFKRWRAVKINAASRSHDDSPELKLLELLEKRGDSLQLLEENHVIMPLETFWIEGPNGRHLCTVLPVLGPTLCDWRHMSLGTDAVRIKNVCYQLTKGVDFLHSRGICHGDLRSPNVLMKLKGNGLDHLEPEDLFELLHYPDRYEVLTTEDERSPHSPKWVIDPLWWSELRNLVSDEVAIVDFGEAFEESSPPKSLGIPKLYAAPEIIYGGLPAGKGVDIWSLAYTIMQIRTGGSPEFSLNAPLRRMERFAGPIPAPYRLAAAEELYRGDMRCYEQYGKQSGWEKPVPPSERLQADDQILEKLTREMTSDSCVRELELELGDEIRESVLLPSKSDEDGEEEKWEVVNYRLPEAEVLSLADLLSKMLKYQPGQRISAAAILKHSWFKIEPETITASVETSDGEQAISPPEMPLPVNTSHPSGLTSLWKLVQKLVPTGTIQISSLLVLLALGFLMLAVVYHLFPANSLCRKIEVTKIIVL